LRRDPSLWGVPLRNLERWEKTNGTLSVQQQIWKHILNTESRESILNILLSKSPQSTHLRSSTPFVGIIDREIRNRIFEKYRQTKFIGVFPCRHNLGL
jgi:hypothetical protein